MSDRYPATIFPDLPKKVLMVKDSTPQQRRATFEKLLQFIAASPKVSNSHIFLEFLGKWHISSVESQKGVIADQRYSVENQKGAIAIYFVQQ